MIEDQNLIRYILSLEEKLAEKVESLCLVSLANASIKFKSKLSNFLQGNTSTNCKKDSPHYPLAPIRAPNAPCITKLVAGSSQVSHPPPTVQSVQVKAPFVVQSGKILQCFGCQDQGIKKLIAQRPRVTIVHLDLLKENFLRARIEIKIKNAIQIKIEA